MTTETYNLLSLIFTIIGFSLTLLGLLFVYRQIRQSIKSREVNILLQLSETSNSIEFNKALDLVWENKITIESGDEEIKQAIKVCVFFELVGSIYTQKYTSTSLIEEFYGSLITGSYDNLEKFIQEYRNKPYNEFFARNFECLSKALESSNVVGKNK